MLLAGDRTVRGWPAGDAAAIPWACARGAPADSVAPGRLGYPSRPFPHRETRLPALLCLCTCPDDAVAGRIATALVDERLAACVNLLPGVRSVYRWQDRVEHAGEVLLLAKTTPARFAALRDRVVALHPYELPEVVAVEIGPSLPAYLEWIAAQVAPAADPD